jgi:hypothetical protein
MKETSEGGGGCTPCLQKVLLCLPHHKWDDVNFNPLKNMVILEIDKYSTYLLKKKLLYFLKTWDPKKIPNISKS